MSDGYRNGATPGGKWGCAASALIGAPLFGLLVLISSMGDCIQGEPCHHASPLVAIGLTLSVVTPFGLLVRWLVNWLVRRRRR